MTDCPTCRPIEEFKDAYPDNMEWTEQNYGRTAGWLRYVDSGEYWPNARIQETEVVR